MASCLNDRFHLVTRVHWAQPGVLTESQRKALLPSALTDIGEEGIKGQCNKIPSVL